MGNPVPRRSAGGTAFHASDCRVWTEISYLDSSTDYREYLPPGKAGRRTETNDLWEPSDGASWPPQTGSYFVLLLACLLFWRSG